MIQMRRCSLFLLIFVALGLILSALFAFSKGTLDVTRGKTFSDTTTSSNKSYSSHRCIGSMNSIEAYTTRVCYFENICYQEGQFLYFRKKRTPILFDKKHGVLYEFSNKGFPFISMSAHEPDKAGFSPNSIVGNISYGSFRAQGKYYLWQHWSQVPNFGHLIWEELGSIYYTQRRFKDVDKSLQILHSVGVPTDPGMLKLIDGILPSISNKPIINLSSFAHLKELTCFERLYVGGSVPLFLLSKEALVEGREEYFMDFRTNILFQFNITANLPSSPVIYITRKSFSHFAVGKQHRAIANVDEVFEYLTRNFPHASVSIMEWHKIPLKEQLEKISSASLLITPCGGVSMIIPFLPNGAHAIVMDYFSDGSFGYEAGESASMEISFWNRFPHIKTMYYQIYSQSDLEWDFNWATDFRNDASIKIDLNRIRDLVDAALETMNYNT